jgi:hypothetical protein
LKTKKDSKLQDIIDETAKSRRLQGYALGYHWQFVIGVPHGEGFDVLAEGAWRQNPEKLEVFAAWRDNAGLEDFLKKKRENQEWVKAQVGDYRRRNPKVEVEWPAKFSEDMAGIERRAPHPWQMLAQSADVAFEFALERTVHLVSATEQKVRAELGVLPAKPMFVQWFNGMHGVQPILRIDWKA